MRKYALLALLVVLLAGCRSGVSESSHSAIDWIDFVKWDGVEYQGIHTGILADQSAIGQKIGNVTFKVADHITNPAYKTKNGDAAFHEKGTGLYAVKGHPDLLAIKDEQAINGYNLYFSTKTTEYQWHFKNVPIEKVTRVVIYQDGREMGRELASEEVKTFLKLLTTSEEVDNFIPDTTKGAPLYYEVVLYTNEPVAYKYGLQFDGTTYYWHPWDTAILSNKIEPYLVKNK
ncbi:hypothetical protein NLX67_04865 [Domibacillus sp. A3M-37]|uniref:hypothetical protein n=1 Tax=Domibacillus sp. A3M-37 TaxID=2962037 RepID=UPI0020B78104|nr:hypothetical protein [Domibacillus sp. A3M-37]MCP3761714.1 hypothetical protein [Domibacillus sp. A3M-37]